MTRVTLPPNYSANPVGSLGAGFTLDFQADLEWVVPLYGSWQGDGQRAQSLRFNNYANPGTIVFTTVNRTGIVPAYSDGYIDIRGVDQIKFTAAQGASVDIEVLTAVCQYGFVSRGNTPNQAGDAFFNYVDFLSHFDGIQGAQSAVNESQKTGSGNVIGGGSNGVSLIAPKFGVGSWQCLNGGAQDTAASVAGNTSTGYTIEAWIKIISLNAGDNVLFGNNLLKIRASAKPLGSLGPNGYDLSAYNTSTTQTIRSLDPVGVIGEWVHVAATFIGNQGYLFGNGIPNQVFGGYVFPGTALGGITIDTGGNHFIDELRSTFWPRYTTNFTLPTLPYPNYAA